jgi:serine/threonine protein kinase
LDGQHLYYTTSYIDGQPYRKIHKKLDLYDRIRILRNAALAVDYAHSKGLWHRDLKPDNILVGSLGEPYVIDWGLVSIQPDKNYQLNIPKIVVEPIGFILPDNLLEATPEAITTLGGGNIVGTPAYMAPEQFENAGQQMGVVSDVWAFGIMLFEVVANHHPLEEFKADRRELGLRILSGAMPSLGDVVTAAPGQLKELCRRMLELDPASRLPNLGCFVAETTRFLASNGQATTALWSNSIPDDGENIISNQAEGDRVLFAEMERQRAKVRILTELAQLGWFRWRKRKQLWSQLVNL